MHDFLDMAVRKVFRGEKNAYQKYQKRRDRDRIPRQKFDDNGNYIGNAERSSSPGSSRSSPIYNSDPGPLPDPLLAPRGGGLWGRQGLIHPKQSIHGHFGPSQHGSLHGSQHRSGFHHVSLHGSPHHSAAWANSMHSAHQSIPGSFHPTPRHSSLHRSPGYPGSIHSGNQHTPAGSRPGSQHSSATASNAAIERAKTYLNRGIGNMQRTIIEGMVPEDQEPPSPSNRN